MVKPLTRQNSFFIYDAKLLLTFTFTFIQFFSGSLLTLMQFLKVLNKGCELSRRCCFVNKLTIVPIGVKECQNCICNMHMIFKRCWKQFSVI